MAVVAADGRSVVLATVADDGDRENDDDNDIEDDTSFSLVDMQSNSEPSSAHTASEKLMQLDDHVWVAVSVFSIFVSHYAGPIARSCN